MVLYNLIKFGNRENYSYEILVQRMGQNEDIFTKINVPIHIIEKKDESDYLTHLIVFLKKERFDVVHSHMNKDLPLVLKAAKEVGISCRIAHSHNARVDIPRLFWPLLYFRHHPYEKYATEYLGCSQLALRWLFPTKWKHGRVIHNGIDLNNYYFNPTKRQQVRNENNISSKTKLFINVGRCVNQKNQLFILELAKERLNYDELYVIIGNGPLYGELVQKKNNLGLNNVIFLGERRDVADWLFAADVFLFPSYYEGLGIVAIEAQAAGLAVLASDTIPKEADIQLGSFHKIPLKQKNLWHKYMSEVICSDEQRFELSKKTFLSKYNIKAISQEVESIYAKYQKA